MVFDNLKSHLTAGGDRGDRACRGEGPAAAAVQPGLHPDRGDVLEGQAGFRRAGARAKEHLYDAIGEALR